jgi:hypothetical protein
MLTDKSEPLLLLTDVPAAIGVPSMSHVTVRTWRIRGVLAADGGRIKLPCVRIGARWFVRASDLKDFIERQQPQSESRQSQGESQSQSSECES